MDRLLDELARALAGCGSRRAALLRLGAALTGMLLGGSVSRARARDIRDVC